MAFIQLHYVSWKSLQFPKQITDGDFEHFLSIIQFTDSILVDSLASELSDNKESFLVVQYPTGISKSDNNSRANKFTMSLIQF